jgi:hypothetical protein
MSDIDVEDVVEAVALAEANSSQTRSVAFSLAFSERYSAENDEEDDVHQSKRKRRHIERNRERGDEDFSSDYLIDSATYTDDHFQRRFGVTKAIFRQLCSSAAAADTFFRPKRDATGRLGHSTEQKVAAALRVLVYAESFDQSDHFQRMSEESVRQSFHRITKHITELYEQTVKLPKNEEAKVISQRFALRGFPGCVGSIDRMKVYWKTCPTAWAGQYQGREESPTIVLEAVVDDRRRFQHAFSGNQEAATISMSLSPHLLGVL